MFFFSSDSFTRSRPAQFRVVYPAHSKMALIIGNSKYEHLEELHEVSGRLAGSLNISDAGGLRAR